MPYIYTIWYSTMPTKYSKVKYWDQIADNLAKRYEFGEPLAEQYRRVHFNLIERWVDLKSIRRILKTDLFAEGLDPSRAFLWDVMKNNSDVVGIDISPGITSRAKTVTAKYAPISPAKYLACDVRHLPFASNTFDLIISDSTLDHFHNENEIIKALFELSRVLKPGGTLFITMDNKSNITEPLFRLWIFFRLSYFFIGKTYSVNELKAALSEAGLRVTDTTAIIHNPRFFARRLISLLHKGNPSRFNRFLRRVLIAFDGLEGWKTKYLTAQFIAAKAIKPSN